MAGKNLNTLVLRGVTVVGDVLTGKMGIGCYPATVQMPALRSLLRHASSSCSQAEQAPSLRHVHAGDGVEDPAARAGRPGCCSRVLARRSPAITAGRIISPRWSAAVGGPRPTAVWRTGRFTTTRSTPVGEGNSWRRSWASALGIGSRLSRFQQARKRQEAGLALKGAGRTLSASTRGTGDR